MWDIPGPGIAPVSAALAGGFLSTANGYSSHQEVPVFRFWKITISCPLGHSCSRLNVPRAFSHTEHCLSPVQFSSAALVPHRGYHSWVTPEGVGTQKAERAGGPRLERAPGGQPVTWAAGPRSGVRSRTSASRMGNGTGKAREFQRLIMCPSSRTERKMEAQLPRLQKKRGSHLLGIRQKLSLEP